MHVKRIIDSLEKSFWFIPALFAILPFIIFYSIFEYAIPASDLFTKYTFFLHIVATPETARLILGAIAGAVITIISISFSITIVVLSIASQQYSPRLLQNFMRQNDTKVILGIFITTFIYCLLTIGLTQNDPRYEAVFTMLAFIGLILGIFSLMAFIYFINYVIQSISLTNIINNIQEDIIATLKKFYPEVSDNPDLEINIKKYENASCQLIIFANESGYLQSINYDQLINEAIKHNFVLKILYSVGDYVIANSSLCEVYYDDIKLSDAIIKIIINQFFINTERKIGEDILFPISQMVDIAVRALSPGVNDPKTAINCIDALAKTMAILSQRKLMPAALMNNSKICIIRPIYTYNDLIKFSFRHIYDNAKNSRAVIEHFVYIISRLVKIPSNIEFKAALLREVNIIRLHNNLTAFDKKELGTIYSTLDIPIMEEKDVTL